MATTMTRLSMVTLILVGLYPTQSALPTSITATRALDCQSDGVAVAFISVLISTNIFNQNPYD